MKKALNLLFVLNAYKCKGNFKNSHTCEEGVAHLSFFLAFTDEFEKRILIRETVEVGQKENKIILIFTVLHFLKEIKKSTWIYHYFTPVYKKSCDMHVLPCLCT